MEPPVPPPTRVRSAARTGVFGFVAGSGFAGGGASLAVGVLSALITVAAGSCAQSALDSGNPIGISAWFMWGFVAVVFAVVALIGLVAGAAMLAVGLASLLGAARG